LSEHISGHFPPWEISKDSPCGAPARTPITRVSQRQQSLGLGHQPHAYTLPPSTAHQPKGASLPLPRARSMQHVKLTRSIQAICSHASLVASGARDHNVRSSLVKVPIRTVFKSVRQFASETTDCCEQSDEAIIGEHPRTNKYKFSPPFQINKRLVQESSISYFHNFTCTLLIYVLTPTSVHATSPNGSRRSTVRWLT